MKIVYLSPVGALGGAERCLLDMLAAVRAERIANETHLIVSTAGPLIEMARDLGVNVTALPMPNAMAELGDSTLTSRAGFARKVQFARRLFAAARAGRRYVRQLRATIARIEPTLIHSNGIKSHLLSGLVNVRNVPAVWHMHDFLGARPLAPKLLRWHSGRVAAAIAVSQAVAKDTARMLPRIPVHTIYNAVDVARFTPGPHDGLSLDRLAGLTEPDGPVVRVGLIATYNHWKGHDIFLQAAAKVLAACSVANPRFYLIGGPIYQTQGSQVTRADLLQQSRRLGIADRVGLIDFQRDVVDVYRGLDIVVHASTQPEPFGLTIVEAMACGKPVIVSRAGGAAELFTQGHDAMGVPPGDANRLAEAIGGLVFNPGQRRRLGENARRTAVSRFSRSRLGPQLAQVYDACCRQHSFARRRLRAA